MTEPDRFARAEPLFPSQDLPVLPSISIITSLKSRVQVLGSSQNLFIGSNKVSYTQDRV